MNSKGHFILISLIILLILFPNSVEASRKHDAKVKSVYELIDRVTPSYSSQFVLELVDKESEVSEFFEISSHRKKVKIRANKFFL